MTSVLTAKQQAFVEAIKRDEESAKWGFEALLEVPYFADLFDALQEAGLFSPSNNPAPVVTADGKYWRIREQKLDDPQRQRILAFLRKCVQFTEASAAPSESLLSHLSRLAAFLTRLGDEEAHWLRVLAPHVGREFFAYEFIKQLARLLPQSPAVVADAFQRMVNAGPPIHDYKGEMKNLLVALAESGQRPVAILLANQMRAIQGMPEVFDKLSTR
jgi:hypothetical protein